MQTRGALDEGRTVRRRPRVAARALWPLAALLLVGCGEIHGIVRTEGAPLYKDAAGTRSAGRLDKLTYLDLLGDPDDDPVEVEVDGRRAFCRLDDLWLYRCPGGRSHEGLLRRQRREVILAEKPWPPTVKQAIRADRLRLGMTREMVSLAWGLPASVTRAPDGEVERWTFERRRWDVRVVAYRRPIWGWEPWYGGFRLGYGYGHGYGYGYGYDYGYRRHWGSAWGPAWGLGFYWPSYGQVVERRYVSRRETYVVRFEQGLVVSWGTGSP